jgi:hypothetical protein
MVCGGRVRLVDLPVPSLAPGGVEMRTFGECDTCKGKKLPWGQLCEAHKRATGVELRVPWDPKAPKMARALEAVGLVRLTSRGFELTDMGRARLSESEAG